MWTYKNEGLKTVASRSDQRDLEGWAPVMTSAYSLRTKAFTSSSCMTSGSTPSELNSFLISAVCIAWASFPPAATVGACSSAPETYPRSPMSLTSDHSGRTIPMPMLGGSPPGPH